MVEEAVPETLGMSSVLDVCGERVFPKLAVRAVVTDQVSSFLANCGLRLGVMWRQ